MFDGPSTQHRLGRDLWSLGLVLLLLSLFGWAPGAAAQSAPSQSPSPQASQSPEKRIALVVGIGK